MNNTVQNITKMSGLRLTLTTVLLAALFIPVGIIHADTWIEDFTSQVQLNLAIFSFIADDWIVDLLDPVTGKGTENYTLEFPTPSEDGLYYYQINVWYTRNSKWYYDGDTAAQNFDSCR